MTIETSLPHVVPTDPTRTTRYIASIIAHEALYHEKSSRLKDFTRRSARAELEGVKNLSLPGLGALALAQFAEDPYFHIENPS